MTLGLAGASAEMNSEIISIIQRQHDERKRGKGDGIRTLGETYTCYKLPIIRVSLN